MHASDAHGNLPTMETWKEVPGFEGLYAVSDRGRAKSLVSGHFKTPTLLKNGYVTLLLMKGGKGIRRYVHSLVLELFVSPRPSRKHECRHLDGCKTNNCVENLAWGTRQENMQDAINHGHVRAGESHPLAKLTVDQVLEIRERHRDGPPPGLTRKEEAALYGVSKATIDRVISRRNWKVLDRKRQS